MTECQILGGKSLNEPNTLQNFYDSLEMKATKPFFPLL